MAEPNEPEVVVITLGTWEAGIMAAKATRASRTSAITTNVHLVLGKTHVVGLLPVSTFAPAALATPAITDIAPPPLLLSPHDGFALLASSHGRPCP